MMEVIVMNNELYHFGVKGMRWGVRRAPKQTGGSRDGGGSVSKPSSGGGNAGAGGSKKVANTTVTRTVNQPKGQPAPKRSSKPSPGAKIKNYNNSRKQQNQPEDLSGLSDKELRQRINRLQMEKQYRQLTAQPETFSGKKVAKEILTNAAKQTLTQYTAKYMAKGIDKGIERAMARSAARAAARAATGV